MEFCTENYLNELLDNSEIYGFDAAKESFYECIANEGAGSTALKIVGGILLVPVVIVAGAVVAALVIVGSVIVLVAKLIQFIVTLPVKIAKAIKEKSMNKAVAAKAVKSETGDKYITSLSQYFGHCSEGIAAGIIAVATLTRLNKMKIVNHSTEELLHEAFEQSDINFSVMTEKLNEELAAVKSNREAVLNSEEKFNFAVNPIEAKNLTTALNRMAPLLKKYQTNVNNLKTKLDATKQAVDKAKSNNESEVRLDDNMAFVDKVAVSYMKFSQDMINYCSYAVRFVNEWATESGRGVLVSGKASKVANSVNAD